MPPQRQYYMLIASLPHLPYFERAQRLPINEVRLRSRLRLLTPEDQVVLERLVAFLAWQRQPVERTDAEVVTFFQAMMAEMRHQPVLRAMIEFRMQERTIMAALRRRHQGLSTPPTGETWGVDPWARRIERHWHDPDFNLGAVVPWLPQARQYLETGEVFELERLLMHLIWRHLDRQVIGKMFGFEAVLAYLAKWDILHRWLSYHREAAQTRFDALMTEVIHGHDQLFA